MNLYHVTKFSPYFPFTLYCFYTKISSFMPVLTIGIVRDCFYLLIFYSEKFSTWVWRLPFAVKVNLNLSNIASNTGLESYRASLQIPLRRTHWQLVHYPMCLTHCLQTHLIPAVQKKYIYLNFVKHPLFAGNSYILFNLAFKLHNGQLPKVSIEC